MTASAIQSMPPPAGNASVAIDEEALRSSLELLGGLAPDRLAVEDLLTEIVQTAHVLFGRDGAGVMLADAEQVLRSVVATDDAGAVLESLQADLGEGPCVDSYVYDRVVSSDDLEADERYPHLGPACCVQRVCAVAGAPLHLNGAAVGGINVYTRVPYHWTGDDLGALSAFGRVAETLLAAHLAAHRNDELAAQLQFALDYRVVIERGVGYLMARDRVDAVTAFNRLRTIARSSRRKVTEVAQELLEGGVLPAR